MRLTALTSFLRRQPLFGPAVSLLILVAVAAAIWAGTGPAGAQDSGELQVSVTADPANPEVNESTRLTATIANPPPEGGPEYGWEGSLEGGEWHSYGSNSSLSWLTGQAETWAFRVTVSYDSGETARSEAVTVTWSEPAPEPTPTPTPEPTEEPTPEPTQEPTPTPTPAPTPPPAPSVAGVAVTSDAGDDDTYILGDVIRITLTFSEAVNVTGSPQLKIDMDPADWGEKRAGYEDGSGTDSLTFAHTVVEPNYSTQGIAVLEDTLELSGGSIKSAASDADAELAHDGRDHDPEHKVDWRRSVPTVSSVEITSDAGDEDTYLLGDVIRVTLTFSERVNVTGSPRLKIDMDPAEWGEKPAGYHSGSGTARLTFAHTVVEPNISTQGIAVLENSLELNGGSIKSAAAQIDAELAHDGRDHDPNHKVDWQRTQPNRAPVINEQAKYYDRFTGSGNAPRGTLVWKPFHDIFTDPDGDELTYTASVPGHQSQLVETLSIRLRREVNGGEIWDILFFRAEDAADWKAISPAMADPVVVTATLTATDPEGMSVSLGGDFLVWWESHPEVVRAVARAEAIELTFDVAVAADPAPTAEQFTVNVVNGDGTTGTVEVSSVSVNGEVVTLELGTELASGQRVTVDYAHDDDTPLKRAADGGDHAASFTGQAVDMSMLGLPGLVSNLEVVAEPGQLDLLTRWDEVEGATSYKLRWREDGEEFQAANAASITGAATGVITVSGYGQWELRAQGCNEDSCGPEAAATVDVVPAASLSLERAVDDQGQVRPRTLTANWDPVEGAASYLLRWWPANENPPAPAQQSSDARQTRSISRREANTQTSNQLTVPAGRTGVEFTVSDDRAYRVDLQARGSGNEILARGDAGVDQAPGQPDTTPPRMQRGEINGNQVTIYFSEDLDEDYVGGEFHGYLGTATSKMAVARSSKMEINGNAVTVDFRGHLWATAGYIAYAAYFTRFIDSTDSTDRALRDLAGNPVSTPKTWQPDGWVSTRVMGLDNITPPPPLDSVAAYPHWLILTFDEPLDGNSVPPASAFTVTVNGSAVSLAGLRPVEVSGNTVRLVLAAPVSATDVLTVSYAKPSSGSKLQGLASQVANFVDHAVTNRVGDAPAVERVAITSTPAAEQIYVHGEAVQVSLTFSEAVTVDTTNGTPRLRIGMPAHLREKWAHYASGSGTATLTFAYSVADLDRTSRGVAVLRNTLDLSGGSIQLVSTPPRDARLWYAGLDHNSNHKLDWRRSAPGVPWVTGVDITSDPDAHGAYSPGESVQVTLTYNQAVNVTGAPRLKIKMAPTYGEKFANYESGGGTTKLVFSYPVVAGNLSTRGVAVLRSTLELNGGAIRSTAATPVNAHLRHEGRYHNSNHRVDGISPSLVGLAVNGSEVSVSFNEALDADSIPPSSAFTVKRTPHGGSQETVSLSGSPTIAGGAVTLTLADPVVGTDTSVKVSYTKPTAATANKMTDAAGNEAASFTDLAVDATDTTPPRIVRGEFDGDVVILYFSEPLDEIYATYEAPEIGDDHFRIMLQLLSNWGNAPDFGQCASIGALSFRTKPREVIIDGNRVTLVNIGYGYEREFRRARVGRERDYVHYVRDFNNNDNVLRDLAGNVASEIIVTLDNVTHLPVPERATVVGNRLTLTFSAPMDRGWVPAASAFSVKVNGSEVSLAGSNHGSVSGREVTLTLAAAVASGDTVTVSYERPDSHWLRNVVCEYAPSFTDRAVTNSTP